MKQKVNKDNLQKISGGWNWERIDAFGSDCPDCGAELSGPSYDGPTEIYDCHSCGHKFGINRAKWGSTIYYYRLT